MTSIIKHRLTAALYCLWVLITACPAIAIEEALGEKGIHAYAVHAKGITGQGVNIALLSNGTVRDSHSAFEQNGTSAVQLYDFTGAGLSRSPHDTHIAGIILSNGSPSHPDAIGVAPGARVHSARFSNKNLFSKTIATALETLITQHHCRVIVTGIQLPSDIVVPNGNSEWSKLYDYYAETYDVIFASAAGNSSPQVTVFGDAHNAITTAGLVKSDPNGLYDTIGSISNHGPTADGRKKPEVCAPTQGLVVPTSSGDDLWETLDPAGRGLTSYAIPHTAGAAALLLEAAAKSTIADDDKSEVIKAVIINSACPLQSPESVLTLSESLSAWKADSGYGKLDAWRAYETLVAGRLVKDQPSSLRRGWAYDVMGEEKEHSYRLNAASGQELVVTLTWHRKLQKLGRLMLEEPTRFFLKLKVVSPSGKILVYETPDSNNLIKTDVALKETGEYRIILTNPTASKNRDYGLAFELRDSNGHAGN